MSNYDQILKRARRVVEKAHQRKNQPKINVIQEGEDIPDSNGLVIILFQEDELSMAV